jgi:hypothetical protein
MLNIFEERTSRELPLFSGITRFARISCSRDVREWGMAIECFVARFKYLVRTSHHTDVCGCHFQYYSKHQATYLLVMKQ